MLSGNDFLDRLFQEGERYYEPPRFPERLTPFKVENVIITDSHFRWSYLKSAVFINVTFDNVDFSDVELNTIVFVNCEFYNCVFSNSNLSSIVFTGCVLEECLLNDSRLIDLTFRSSIINLCNFRNSVLEDVAVTEGSKLCNNNFLRSKLTNIQGIKIQTFDLNSGEILTVNFSEDMVHHRLFSGHYSSVYHHLNEENKHINSDLSNEVRTLLLGLIQGGYFNDKLS